MSAEQSLAFVPDPANLRGRVIMVTGAASGIGLVLSIALARAGATVLMLDRQLKALEKAYDQVAKAGAEPMMYPIDFAGANWDDYQNLATHIKSELGGLDGLVLNAAQHNGFVPLAQHEIGQWFELITANLHAPFMLLRACLAMLLEKKHAAVVVSLDDADLPYYGAYGASKAGLLALTRQLANEYQNSHPGLRVSSINSGPLKTPLRVQNFPGEDKATLAEPSAIMGAYLYCLVEDSGATTGTELVFERLSADQDWPGYDTRA